MNEQKKQKTVRKIVISIILILFLALGGAVFAGYRYVQNGLEPLDPASEEIIEVEIPTGSSRSQIGSILEQHELINSSLIFDFYVRFSGENSFQAGSYLMSPSMSLDEIVHYLNEGGTPIMVEPIARLSIPEGIHLEEIAEKIEAETDFSGEDFMVLVEDSEFIKRMVDQYPQLLTDSLQAADVTRYVMEGYLFPATYEIFEETTLESLVVQMINRMNQAMSPHYDTIAAGELNTHEILTLASHIEREGVTDEDRGLISGVFYNRLEVGMMLQTDPSVSYALGEHRERTSHADLEVDSPYNTYRVHGVGAGPINSPSESAISASVNPTETEYYYFLADLTTGEIYYSEDYEQHLEYQNEYLRNNN